MRRFTVLVLSVTLGVLVLVPLWGARGAVVAAPAFVVPPGTIGTPPPSQISTSTPTATISPVATNTASATAVPTNAPSATAVPTNAPSATAVPTVTACGGAAFFDDQASATPTPCPTTPAATATAMPPTAVPTATTSPPMGAPARIVARATLRHFGKTAVVRWRMAYALGIKGFRIYAKRRLLTRSLIRPHRSPNYTVRVPWMLSRSYRLVVLFNNGRSQGIAVH